MDIKSSHQKIPFLCCVPRHSIKVCFHFTYPSCRYSSMHVEHVAKKLSSSQQNERQVMHPSNLSGPHHLQMQVLVKMNKLHVLLCLMLTLGPHVRNCSTSSTTRQSPLVPRLTLLLGEHHCVMEGSCLNLSVYALNPGG